jgi:hypothetical protein
MPKRRAKSVFISGPPGASGVCGGFGGPTAIDGAVEGGEKGEDDNEDESHEYYS